MSNDQHEQNAYNNYRAALRSLGGYAPARRQEARRLTVERYGISYKTLKAIIKKYDEANGIVHDENKYGYDKRAVADAQKEYDQNPTPCTECAADTDEDIVRPRLDVRHLHDTGNTRIVTTCYVCWLLGPGRDTLPADRLEAIRVSAGR